MEPLPHTGCERTLSERGEEREVPGRSPGGLHGSKLGDGTEVDRPKVTALPTELLADDTIEQHVPWAVLSLVGHDKVHLATAIWLTAHVLYVELMRGIARAGALRAQLRRVDALLVLGARVAPPAAAAHI